MLWITSPLNHLLNLNYYQQVCLFCFKQQLCMKAWGLININRVSTSRSGVTVYILPLSNFPCNACLLRVPRCPLQQAVGEQPCRAVPRGAAGALLSITIVAEGAHVASYVLQDASLWLTDSSLSLLLCSPGMDRRLHWLIVSCGTSW